MKKKFIDNLFKLRTNLLDILVDTYPDEGDIHDTFKNVLTYSYSVVRAAQKLNKGEDADKYSKMLKNNFSKLIESVQACQSGGQVYSDHTWYKDKVKPVLDQMITLLEANEVLVSSKSETAYVGNKRPRLSNSL